MSDAATAKKRKTQTREPREDGGCERPANTGSRQQRLRKEPAEPVHLGAAGGGDADAAGGGALAQRQQQQPPLEAAAKKPQPMRIDSPPLAELSRKRPAYWGPLRWSPVRTSQRKTFGL